ncbi:tetratricopeptide repeat protein [uncultured Roseibium sp.]|uniref:tetratricopeptide repeat protein n=1 Tax=uncultured Roseibium sp. TaxID=1936171 RepID=UPI00260B12ED|nr:tetratricopeptide repeat protein [uncultured Roseibium sp.]
MLTIEERLEAARGHLEERRHENAALIFEGILDAAPHNLAATTGLAALKMAEGDLDTAERLLTSALSRGQVEADLLALAAKVALLRGSKEKALEFANQALSLDELHIDASLLRINMLLQDGKLREAEPALHTLCRAHPENPSAAAMSVMLLTELGDFRHALDLAQDSLAKTSKSEEIEAAMGHCLSRLGDHEKALGYLESAHFKDPTNPLYALSLAKSLLETGQATEALRVAKRATVRFPELLPAWLIYVEIMIRRGETMTGLREFTPVIQRAQDRLDASLHLAQAYRMAGYPEKSLEVLKPILAQLAKLPPDKAPKLAAIARECFLASGHPERVSETFGLEDEPSSEKTEDIDLASGDLVIVIPPGQSNLELVPLMRFLPQAGMRSEPLKIVGPSTSRQLADVFGSFNYLSGDLAAENADTDLPEEARFLPLPLVLGLPGVVDAQNLFPEPYAKVLPDRKVTWQRSLAEIGGPRVAMCWHSSRPGMLLQDFRHLFQFTGCSLVSSAWGSAREQLKDEEQIIDAGAHFRDLHDLTALLDACDLVIGPDSIPIHIAGSLGKPGIVLLDPAHPWYWHNVDGRSTWYPSIRVLKTKRFGHWVETLPEVAADINQVIQETLETQGS